MMCWQAAVMIGMQAAGGGFQMLGQQQSAMAEQQVLRQQAKLDKWRAKDARARGVRRADLTRNTVRQVVAGQEASFAGRGIDIDSGVVGDFATETEFFGQMEVDNILANAEREAFGFDVSAQNAIFQGKTARHAANLASIGTALGIGSSAGMSWLEMRRFQSGGMT